VPQRLVAELRPHSAGSIVPPLVGAAYAAFVADVAVRGVVTALEITPENEVLDGQQRLRAALELGLARVPVRIVEVEEPERYVLLAVLSRRDLSQSQKAVLALELADYDQLRAEAAARSRANLKNAVERATLPTRGRSRQSVAAVGGVGERTIQDVAAVRAADPLLYERIWRDEISASAAFREIKQRDLHARLGGSPPLPDGQFDVLYGDPPWRLGNPGGAFAPENHYCTLAVPQIIAVAPPAAENAVLYLWVVNSLLEEGLEVLRGWGFQYVSQHVWVKTNGIGLGQWVRHRHELLLIGRRGNFSPPAPGDRFDSVIEAPRGRHSAKPDVVYQMLEQMYPGTSKLELFARGHARPGWTFWGNEASNG
jgi:N6-adenosine-specific RNA methylase IME4